MQGLEPPSPALHLNPTMAFYPRFNYHNLPPPPDDGGLPKRRCATTWNAGYRSSSDEPRVFELSPAATGVRELGLVFCEERLVGGRRAAREEDASAYGVDAREAAEVVCGYAGGWAEAWVRRGVEEGRREEAVVVEECVGRVIRVVVGPDGYRSSELEEGVSRRELAALVRGKLAERRSR